MPDNITLEPDEPPKNGVWVDVHDVLANPTPEEQAEGERRGLTVHDDPDEDDQDSDQLAPQRLGFARAAASDKAVAVAEAKKLKRALLAAGVPEVEIRLTPGRPNSFGTWAGGFFVADMGHHIVSRLGSNKTPGLQLVEDGRPDLEGPLCNSYGGFDLCARIICMSYANHPGEGGPITVPATHAGTFTIPKDSARRYAFGWEFEGGLNERDWDVVLENPRNGARMTMREFMDRCLAGTQNHFDVPVEAHLEHSTWTSRKIDRLGITRAEGIAGIRRYRDVTPTEPEDKVTPVGSAHRHFIKALRHLRVGVADVEDANVDRPVASRRAARISAIADELAEQLDGFPES